MLQLFKIMKDHKNPKVLSEGLSWMVTALDDFGIGHVPLKVSPTSCCGFYVIPVKCLFEISRPVRNSVHSVLGVYFLKFSFHFFVLIDCRTSLISVKKRVSAPVLQLSELPLSSYLVFFTNLSAQVITFYC